MSKFFFILSFAMLVTIQVTAQDFENIDPRTIEVDNLTDEQIQKFVDKARASGLTEVQLEELARRRGVSEIQISKLRSRIYSLNPDLAGTEGSNVDVIERKRNVPTSEQAETTDVTMDAEIRAPKSLPIFGLDFFNPNGRSFQSPVNIPTPANYVLGSGDEVIIDVYGASETNYKQTISPDGRIMVSGVGPITIGGLQVEAAKRKIFSRLATIYSGLRGPNPNTFIQLTVGNIRTISINVVGRVANPGTYTVSSFSSMIDALFAAGGPTAQGSMRNIRLVRRQKVVATLDLYQSLYSPEGTENVILENGDHVVVDSYLNRVSLTGEVKSEAKYELFPGETVADLMRYSGGLAEDAYADKIVIERSTGKMKSILTVDPEAFESTELQSGDSINIGKIIDRFENRVSVQGAVFRPGNFELTDGMLLSELIEAADGFREDAFLGRANIFRQNKDLTLKNITFSPKGVMEGSSDFVLQSEDQVVVQSIFDLREALKVQIKGEIRSPGVYAYRDGLTVEDLIAQSGGFMESANKSVVEVARQLKGDQKSVDRTAEIFTFKINQDLSISDSASSFELKPFDVVLVKRSSFFQGQQVVRIEGEVLYPGYYALETREDKISDLIERAGGLTDFAYVDGATVLRRTEFYKEESTFLAMFSDELESDKYKSERLKELQQRDADSAMRLGGKESIGIDLEACLKSPNSKHDLILKDGDVLSVPRELQTVRVRGNVLYPNTIRFEPGMSAKKAVSMAGGFTDGSRPSKTYVIYANGSAERTKGFLFFRKYPKLNPGAEVIVPKREFERERLNAQQIIGLSSSLATLVLVLTQINR